MTRDVLAAAAAAATAGGSNKIKFPARTLRNQIQLAKTRHKWSSEGKRGGEAMKYLPKYRRSTKMHRETLRTMQREERRKRCSMGIFLHCKKRVRVRIRVGAREREVERDRECEREGKHFRFRGEPSAADD